MPRRRRQVPDELVDRLHAAVSLEALVAIERGALSQQRRNQVARATGMLLCAAVAAGWRIDEVAGHAGLLYEAAWQRVTAARTRLDGATPGLIVAPPPVELTGLIDSP